MKELPYEVFIEAYIHLNVGDELKCITSIPRLFTLTSGKDYKLLDKYIDGGTYHLRFESDGVDLIEMYDIDFFDIFEFDIKHLSKKMQVIYMLCKDDVSILDYLEYRNLYVDVLQFIRDKCRLEL